MDEFVFTCFCGFVADFGAAGLIIRAVGTTREFTIFLLGGDPSFDVVFFGGRIAEIAGTDIEYLISETEILHDFFFNRTDEIVFLPRFFRMAKTEHFYFVELVDADNALRIFAVRAGFAAEAS